VPGYIGRDDGLEFTIKAIREWLGWVRGAKCLWLHSEYRVVMPVTLEHLVYAAGGPGVEYVKHGACQAGQIFLLIMLQAMAE